MPLLRRLAVLFAFVAAFARPAPASAFTPASLESRVGGFEVAAQLLVRDLGAASGEQHQGIGAAYDENASGYRFAAGCGGARTFEILDGVRRAKAAELAGRTSITAEIRVGGRVVETAEVPLESLRSPFKSAIDVSSSPAQMQRFQSIMQGTRAGDPLPPITVQPGTRGPSIFDIFFE